ncbi:MULTISPECIES: tetratricopeptide repeat protein [unclassified Saccharothrix]|uniref:tetratricopeptide repeat protein n=1 Tax=unclassified Saccharothrix TaxID=2593673 RepID=UPI00307EB87C
MTTENAARAGTVGAVVQAGAVHGDITIGSASPRVPVPHNLPPPAHRFVGRRRELDRLTALATAAGGSRVCVLDGPPGIGKTELAVQWGASVRGLFPDGHVYVDLRGFDPTRPAVDPAEAPRLILGALHVPLSSVPAHPDDQLALLRSVLDQRRLLLVVDNARGSDQVRPLLSSSRGCFTVVTSRHRLDGLAVQHGAERIPVAPLRPAESVRLLAEHLGTHRVRSEHAAVARVVTACGGHPLALSVVAARAADPAESLDAIVRELESRGGALDALRLADVGDLRAVLSLSCENLPAGVQREFRTLALHPGAEFDVAAAAAMTGGDTFRARETIRELVRCHLLGRTSSGRFAFHTLTYAFAAEQARAIDPAERAASRIALLNHQLHAANRADRLINGHRRPVPLEPCLRPELLPALATRADALAWFTTEYDNVLAAAALARREGLDAHTWQLAWTIPNFAHLTGRWRDWIQVHTAAVEAVRGGDRSVEVRLRQSLARAHFENGDHGKSVEGYVDALRTLEELGDVPGRANALNGLAAVQLGAGAPDAALRSASAALDLYGRLEVRDDAGTASTHHLLGRTCETLGRPAEARHHHLLAHDLYTRSDDLYGLAKVADAMAGLESAAGRDGRARGHLRQAVALHFRAGNVVSAAESCRRLRSLLEEADPVVDVLSRAIAALADNRESEAAALVGVIARSGPVET